jgi:cyclic beta-1,2-glucan synthetase
VEPYAVPADVYSEAPHEGRGGWTWYTGAAGWLYRAGLEPDHRREPEGSLPRCIPGQPGRSPAPGRGARPPLRRRSRAPGPGGARIDASEG